MPDTAPAPETIVITRHTGLVDWLFEQGVIDDSVPVFSFASPDQVRGKHVIGILPLYIAAEAELITEYPVVPPPGLRGADLDVDQVRQFVRPPRTYRVTEIKKEKTNEHQVR